MKSFTYEARHAPPTPRGRRGRTAGAKFIAGGTNLLDLMKLQIETPRHLIDVNGLAPRQDRADTGRRPAHRRAGEQHRPRRRSPASGRDLRLLSRAPAGRRLAVSCATRPRPRATCCSGRDALLLRHQPALQQAPAGQRLQRRRRLPPAPRGGGAGARPASPRTRATWPWPCARSGRASGRRCRRIAVDAIRIPGADVLSPARRHHAAHRDGAGAGRADHRCYAAAAAGGAGSGILSQGPATRTSLRLRPGLGRRNRAAGRHGTNGAAATSPTSRGASKQRRRELPRGAEARGGRAARRCRGTEAQRLQGRSRRGARSAPLQRGSEEADP